MAQELQLPKRWQKEFSTVNPIFRNDTITICFLGDVMMHTKQIETARQGESGYDFSTYFMLIEDKIRNADLAVANMEFPLGGEPYSGYPVFSAPDPLAEYGRDRRASASQENTKPRWLNPSIIL